MADYVSKYTGAQIDEAVGKALNGGTDGEDGADGVGIKSVVQTTTSAVDGGTNVITVTKTDGTTSTFTVKNGSKGSTGDKGDKGDTGPAGADGAKGDKGDTGDTGADGTSVTVSSVSESTADGGSNVVTFSDGKTLTIKNGSKGSTGDTGPAGADGKDGSDATVTADSIRDALGYTPADVTAVFEAAESPLFTNVFDTVAIEYGKLINPTDKTIEDTSANLATTGYIPVSAGSIIRVNDDFPISNTGSPAYILYDADKNPVTALRTSTITEGGYYVSLVESDSNGYIRAFQINKPSSSAYIRIANDSDLIGNNPVLTVDEEITYEMGYGTKMNSAVRVDYSQITNSPQKNGWSILPNEHLAICYSGINRKPINTVEHFTDAAENFGYNALKCDVRPTSDGELVCCHDAGFTFDANGYITTYDSSNATVIHDVTAETVLGYSFATGEHPCLVGDYLDVCRKYGKVAFITIRNEYMDVVIPKLLEELRVHNMTYSTIINCMTYESLVQWRQQDSSVMINYTLNYGVAIDQTQIDRAVGLGYCSLCGFSLSSASTDPSASCDFDYARANGIRLLEAIAYKEGSPEACYALGYDGCQIGIPWGTPDGGVSEESVQTMIDAAIGTAIGGAY